MKREYSTPTVEKIAFRYRDQIVVASGEPTTDQNTQSSEHFGGLGCVIVDFITTGPIDGNICFIS